ncbi:hypothetical protein Q427_27325 [Halomonas sp. BC04]|nr:hypothetical protein Q427_27325 [Halomonas sp. BC04]
MPSPEQRERLRRKRAFRDNASRYGIGAAGIGVVIALGMIFVYLFSEVMPLFKSAQVSTQQTYAIPGVASDERLEHLTIDRHDTLGASFTDTGRITFFDLEGGDLRASFDMSRPEGATRSAFATAFATTRAFAYGYDNGVISSGRWSTRLPTRITCAISNPS